MENRADLLVGLLLWLVAGSVILLVHWKRNRAGGGLIFAYLIHLWMIHWVAPAAYLAPWYEFLNFNVVMLGFEQSLYGILAFAGGSLIVTPFLRSRRSLNLRIEVNERLKPLANAYMTVGVVAYMLTATPLKYIPSFKSLIAVGQQFAVLGLCLACWHAWHTGHRFRFFALIGVMCFLPFITVVTRGFIGHGVDAVLVIVAFIASFFRPRWKIIVVGLTAIFLGLSVYVNYMRDRGDIRDTVWGRQSYVNRMEQIMDTLEDFEWFDWKDESHLLAIDQRLNQNFIVGMAVANLLESKDFADGETIKMAAFAVVPRILWPEKPVYAGSPGLVSEYTGLEFAHGTSVGVGQVMEFHINYGTTGVVIGFMLMGMIITVIDITAWRRLLTGNPFSFVLLYLVGISFLQVAGSLVEVAGTAAASVVLGLTVNTFMKSRFSAGMNGLKAESSDLPADHERLPS